MSPELSWRIVEKLRKDTGDIWSWEDSKRALQVESQKDYRVAQFVRSGSYFNLRIKYQSQIDVHVLSVM
jgi:hypothetical protein